MPEQLVRVDTEPHELDLVENNIQDGIFYETLEENGYAAAISGEIRTFLKNQPLGFVEYREGNNTMIGGRYLNKEYFPRDVVSIMFNEGEYPEQIRHWQLFGIFNGSITNPKRKSIIIVEKESPELSRVVYTRNNQDKPFRRLQKRRKMLRGFRVLHRELDGVQLTHQLTEEEFESHMLELYEDYDAIRNLVLK